MIKYKLNKKIVLIIGIILLASGAAFATYAAGLLLNSANANGLVLDVNLAQHNYNSSTKVFTDKSGTGNNGASLNAAAFETDNNGQANAAMNFNGTSDYVNLGDIKTLGSFTYSAWVKLNTLNATGMIFDKEIGGSLWPSVRGFIGTDNKYYFGFHKSSSIGQTFPSASTLTSGRWYHLTGTYDGSTVKIYIDGALSSSNSASGVPNNINNKLILGATQMNSSPYYINLLNGSIANVKIYNRALSATEIQALYNSGKAKMAAGSIQKGLIAHWALDGDGYNATTGRITDKTPYENHGTNNGATLTTDKNGQTGGAFSFNGTTGKISVADNNSLDFGTGDFSICFFMKANNLVGSNKEFNVISKTASSDNSPGWVCELSTWGGSATSFGFTFANTGHVWGTANAGGPAALAIDTWYHICGTRSGTTLTAYVNAVAGTPVTNANVGANVNNAIGVKIGEKNTLWGYYFPGSLSDIRIYNRALSADEVSLLYGSYKPKATAGSLQQGLVLDMPLTSTYTKTVTAGSEIMTDRTPYSNDGQNYGATVGSDSTSFNGSSNNISTTLGGGSVKNNFTFGGWFKTSSTMQIDAESTTGVVGTAGEKYAMWPNNIGTDSGAGLSIGTNGISVYEHGNSYMPAVSVYNSSIGSDWNHIIIVYTNKQSKTYLNGVLIHTGLTSPKTNVYAPNTVGGEVYGYFNGSISGVKIYNRALSTTEVKSLYDKGR